MTQRSDHPIMVIDDETTVLQAFNVLLEMWGYRVLAARSESDALDLLDDTGARPVAILADYRLREGRTGLQAIQTIRSRLGAAIPSIIITGDTTTEGLREARASGMTVLQKPVLPPHLRAVLAQTISQAGA